MPIKLVSLSMILLPALALAGCKSSSALPQDSRTEAADQACIAKWGKGLGELPADELVLIGAHNENIFDEYRWAFSLHHAVEFGRRVNVSVRDAGGGGTSIETYLLNVYASSGSPEIDVIWGGGDSTYIKLAKGLDRTGPLLKKLQLTDDIIQNVPAEFSGVRMVDPDMRWIASAVSGFGFIYNAGMLKKCNIPAPQQWDDLGRADLAGLLQLADPSESASAAAAYRMIAMSADDWPAGWAKLLRILANSRIFSDSAGSAANAPVLGEALVATCIDFYGATRVAEAPDELVFVTPKGQTVFTPDPIGILIDAPHPEIAKRFVNFVLSRQGQAMWALPPNQNPGPVRSSLGRQPARRDVYEIYAGKMLTWIVNPYRPGVAMPINPGKATVNFSLLRTLVFCAAVENQELLAQARDVLIRSNYRADLMEEFNKLPPELATIEAVENTAKELKDKKRYEQLTRNWRDFFRQKYVKIRDAK